MNEKKIANAVAGKYLRAMSEKQKKYQKFFDKTLAKYDAETPADLSAADKKKFFEEIDRGWKSEEESK